MGRGLAFSLLVVPSFSLYGIHAQPMAISMQVMKTARGFFDESGSMFEPLLTM